MKSHILNDHTRANHNKECDQDWIRSTHYTGVMGAWQATQDPAYLDLLHESFWTVTEKIYDQDENLYDRDPSLMKPAAIHTISALVAVLLAHGTAQAQAPNSAWVYPSATGNLLYQLDSRGQRIADFSQCGYRGGTDPLPNVTALIPQSRWVVVSPGTGDDTALIQAAIDSVEAMTPDANGWRGAAYLNAGEYQLATTLTIQASGVVLKGASDSSTTGTRLRATDARQYALISATNSTSRSTVSGTTHNLTQKLVPAGSRTFEVDSTSGLAVGHAVIVKRPSPANWIADIGMDQLGAASGDPTAYPWTAGCEISPRSISAIRRSPSAMARSG